VYRIILIDADDDSVTPLGNTPYLQDADQYVTVINNILEAIGCWYTAKYEHIPASDGN